MWLPGIPSRTVSRLLTARRQALVCSHPHDHVCVNTNTVETVLAAGYPIHAVMRGISAETGPGCINRKVPAGSVPLSSAV